LKILLKKQVFSLFYLTKQ